jgi:hypothetical protein
MRIQRLTNNIKIPINFNKYSKRLKINAALFSIQFRHFLGVLGRVQKIVAVGHNAQQTKIYETH